MSTHTFQRSVYLISTITYRESSTLLDHPPSQIWRTPKITLFDLMNTALNTLRKKAMWFVKCDELESNQGDLHRLYSDVVDRLDIDLTFYVTQISMMK